MATTFIGDMDMSKVHFVQSTASDGRSTRVEVYKDNTGTTNKNKIEAQLCRGTGQPIQTKFSLDTVRDGENPDRRGLALKLYDPVVLKALKELDEAIIKAAVANSKEWFKKTLTEEAVRSRYKPIASLHRDEDDHHMIKVKVKCGNSVVPTVLHLRDPVDGTVSKRRGTLAHFEVPGAHVVPIVSTHALWFMGGGMHFGLSFQVEAMIVTPAEAPDELDKFLMDEPIKVAKLAPTVVSETVEDVQVRLDGDDEFAAM